MQKIRWLGGGIIILLFSSIVFGASTEIEGISQELVSTHLTMQIGLDYGLVGLAIVNQMNQPVFTLGTSFIGIVCRITLNAPSRWEVEDVARKILEESPQISQELLKEKTKNRILGSRSLTFFEIGFFTLPFFDLLFPIPFIGGGAYIPLGTTSTFLVAHLNLPFIGGLGIVYIF